MSYNTQEGFFGIAGFSKVTGIIDCTHVQLHACRLGPQEPQYVNRKSRHSINVQLVCNHQYNIINAVARWTGATHDSRIIRMSRIGRAFANHRLHDVLLGDSGYPLLPWIMTRVINPESQEQILLQLARFSILISHTTLAAGAIKIQIQSELAEF